MPERAAQLTSSLAGEFPQRNIKVISGDCNLSLQDGLDWIRNEGGSRSGPHLGQTLAFLDPDSLELEWDTVVRLANWQMSNIRPTFSRRNRIELLILFPTGPMRRQLPQTPKAEASEQKKRIVDRLFGSPDWRFIYEAQRQEVIKGEESWLYYVDLYRLQLSRLGYKYTAAIEVKNTRNVVLYHMIFATSNDTGQKIMKTLLTKAREVLPIMVDEEKARRGALGPRLFEESEVDLERIKANPGRWAKLFADPPVPFDPENPKMSATSREKMESHPQFPIF
ncbi:MAG: hypothetical protein JWM55_1879 [Acidimicrobiaceae bacterium]|nr:hypothetical protein [Acidimicrobiaceae bacterium]